jgi:hypothetical protein
MNRHETTAHEPGGKVPELPTLPLDDSNEKDALTATARRKQQHKRPSQRSRPGAGAKRGGEVESSPSIAAATPLRRSELRELLATHAEHRLSLYMPLHAPGAEGPQNSVRLKNLLREAQSQLVLRGLRPADARAMLRPANSLVTNAAFWRQSEGGLALLLAPNVFRCDHLPMAVAEQVHVGRRFIVRPLLALLDGSDRFWLLAVSQNAVRLFRGDADRIAPIEVEGLPRDMSSALNLDISITGDQVHSASNQPLQGKQAAVFHGQGGESDTRKEELQEYFRAIDAALRDTLQAEPAPLVVACVDYEFALYREVNTYPHLIGRALTGNVEHLGLKELHAQAWPLAEPHLGEKRRHDAGRCARLVPAGKASPHITEVLPAACEGRVETLFIARDTAVWGVHDRETGAVEVHAQSQPGDEDLLELAAVETLTHNGTVYSVPADEVPGSGSVVAILRF